jgi:predicted  nucleic acid-binding Zn-ribbon protein
MEHDMFWIVFQGVFFILSLILLVIAGISYRQGKSLQKGYNHFLSIQDTYKHLKSQIEKYEKLVNQIDLLKEEINELQEEENKLLLRVNEYREKEDKYNNYKKEIEQLDKDKRKKSQEIADLDVIKEAYDKLQKENERLESAKVALNQEKNNIKSDIKQIEEQHKHIDEWKKEIRELEGKIDNLKLAKEELEKQIKEKAKIQSEIEELKNEKKELGKTIKDEENSQIKTFESLKDEIPGLKLSINTNLRIKQEVEFLDEFKKKLKDFQIHIPERIIHSFHTSLKIQDTSALTVLAGISGTGKSMLPKLYADMSDMNFVMLPVQPRWDSSQDILGLYNYAEKKYKATDLARLLYQYNQSENSNRMTIFLFDEMNLARVEYYFSDFLSLLELRAKDADKAKVELDLGPTKIAQREKNLLISKKILFVGTINEDDSTQTFSDKVLDRSNIIRFNTPDELIWKNPFNNGNIKKLGDPIASIDYSTYNRWAVKEPDSNNDYFSRTENLLKAINDELKSIDRSFAHRLAQSMMTYVANYPGINTGDRNQNWKYAISDQIAQKIMPKLRGADLENASVINCMDQLIKKFKKDIDDILLIEAFEKAKKSDTGFFQWHGLHYTRES